MTRRVALAAAALVAVAGCATVPSHGPVHIARDVQQFGPADEPDVGVLPPGPADNAGADDIVLGFLHASADNEQDYQIAREYLTTAADQGWRPGSAAVTVYNAMRTPVVENRSLTAATVSVGFSRRGYIAPDGGYTPAPGTFTVRFDMQRVRGEWRVAHPPTGLLLSAADVDRGYRVVDEYFIAPADGTLVPDRVFLAAKHRDLPTALVRRLLSGPSSWLAPAVRTGFPHGTRLLQDVTIDNGIAEVDLSAEARRADTAERKAMCAQLVWTLGQLSQAQVAGVRVMVQGGTLSVPGVGAQQTTADWASYSPDVVPRNAPLYFERDGRLRTLDANGQGAASTGDVQLQQPAVSPTLDRVAGLRFVRGGLGLYVGPLTGTPELVLRAARLTTPSIDGGSRVWTVATSADGRQQVEVVVDGVATEVAAGPLLALGEVRDLRVSRDGARVAAVVGNRTPTLVVARIDAAGGPRIDGVRRVLPDGYVDVAGVTWADHDSVVTLARTASEGATAGRFPVTASTDGWQASPGSAAGLPDDASALTSITGAPTQPLVVSVDGVLWAFNGIWHQLDKGTDPAYPG